MRKKNPYKWKGLFLLGIWGLLCSYIVPVLPVWAEVLKVEAKPQVLTQQSSEKKPDLQFEQKIYDFGTINKGDSVTHKFKFTNKGDGVLNIEQVKTSCGCTAAMTSSKSLNSGESGTIEATFNSRNFRGRITKKIYVNSNDPDEGIIQLVIKGTILEGLKLKPNVR